jgi:parallel beta-helix repeat protein
MIEEGIIIDSAVDINCSDTVFLGKGNGIGATLRNSYIKLKGCTFRNFSYAIKTNYSEGNPSRQHIFNCSFYDNENALFLESSGTNNITGNYFKNNKNGIVGWHSSLNTFSSNILLGSDEAFLLHNVRSSYFIDNIVNDSIKAFRLWWDTKENSFENNSLDNNQYGFFFDWKSDYNTFYNNLVINNQYGFYVQEDWFGSHKNNSFIDNDVRNNNYGFYLGNATNFVIRNNLIEGNDKGLYFVKSNNNNVFYNEFESNIVQASEDLSNNWNHSSGGNYWSNYNSDSEGCFDSNFDGFCDSPYSLDNSNDNFPFKDLDLSCVEYWTQNEISCGIDDRKVLTYKDKNYCGTSLFVPLDNGTYESCNYCSPSYIFYSMYTLCNESDQRIKYYIDRNFDRCCAVTGLESDCPTRFDSNYMNQTLSCDFCEPNWIAYNTSCINDTLTEYYLDSNNCYAQTGLVSDNIKPLNVTHSCDSIKCNSDADCGDHYWLDSPYCAENSVLDINKSYTCENPGTVNATCVLNNNIQIIETCSGTCYQGECVDVDCDLDSDCGTNGWIGNKWCDGKDVKQNYRTYTCDNPGTVFSNCSYTDVSNIKSTCGEACFDGECVQIDCNLDSDCGTDSWLASPYCSSNNVWDTYRSYLCSYPGTINSSCSYVDLQLKKDDCDDYCDFGSCAVASCNLDSDCGNDGWVDSPVCNVNEVWQNYRSYNCNNPGTANASCNYTDDFQLKETCSNVCLAGRCDNIECANDADCPADSFSNNFCIGSDSYRVFTNYSCINPGTSSSECVSTVSSDLVQNCNDGLYCNGQESCFLGDCVNGVEIDCSVNNNDIVSECGYSPDDNPFTFDSYPGFVSACDEAIDSCTTDVINVDSECSISQCGAECEQDSDCDETDCDDLDGCYGKDYRDYHDEENSCVDCECEENSCSNYDESVNDERCLFSDLVVESYEITSSSLRTRQWIMINIVVKNDGDKKAENIYWELDTGSSQNNPNHGPFSLEPGQSVDINAAVKYTSSGSYNLVFEVDKDNSVEEYDETNNEIEIDLTIY